VILGLLVLVGVSALVIRFAPAWLVSTSGLSGTARLDELSRVRVALLVLTLATIAGGVTLYVMHTSTRARREESRERQFTERFMRAVEQLGHPTLDVRLGGIYSLERLARESRENHGPVMEILAAYVREHAPWPARAAGGPGGPRARPATDVQAALTILGRRILAHDTDAPIALGHTALAGASLTGAHLERALLSGANLEGADLFKAQLDAADLEGTSLRGAGLLLASLNDTVLWSANLEAARLYGATLEGAALKGANLKNAGLTGANLKDAGLHGAILAGADLTGANLEGVGLEGANLGGTNLQGANLRGAVLLGALYDDATTWPNGFDAAAEGAVRRGWRHEPESPAREPEAPAHEPARDWGPEPDDEAYPPDAAEVDAPDEEDVHSRDQEAVRPRAAGRPHEARSPEARVEWPPRPAGWPHEAHDAPQTGTQWPPAPAEASPGSAGETSDLFEGDSPSSEPQPRRLEWPPSREDDTGRRNS
jgi:uncharacterized protein YjbI with pentapeptide repeats